VAGPTIISGFHSPVEQESLIVLLRGPQTNIAGDAKGPVVSGQFESATAVGGGEAASKAVGKMGNAN